MGKVKRKFPKKKFLKNFLHCLRVKKKKKRERK